MPTTAGKALPYPATSDPVAQGADAIRKLAQSADNMTQAGFASIDLATDTNNTVTVTFPVAYDAAGGNPIVIVGTSNAPAAGAGAGHSLWATGRSPTGFTAGARRSVALAGFTVLWVSVGKVATVA